jgi:uncharacterized membrane protein YfcA
MLLALLGALIVGISLGVLGSGGSILTVPVLVFVLHRPEKLAIAESLFIVGMIALIGAIPYAKRGQIHWISVLFFGLSGMAGSYVGACCSYYLSGAVQLTLFAFVMLIVALVMLMNPLPIEKNSLAERSHWMMIGQGFFVGGLTGLIGVGGGFLLVPALVLLRRLPLSISIGTSLVIIAFNAFIGFGRQFMLLDALQSQLSWHTLIYFSIIGVSGSLIGGFITKKISQNRLKQVFGMGILLIGICILVNQMIYYF